jgi:K+-transporting ATPase KdpF subunit
LSPPATRFEGRAMILLTAVVTLLLFIYLMAALLRPEWF